MLYLVSTPIGNLGDISERAKQVLNSVHLVACEDTRTSGQLFSLLGIQVAATIPYHDHNADTMRPKLIEKLKKGVMLPWYPMREHRLFRIRGISWFGIAMITG